MVKIETIEELKKIMKSNYGFVIIITDTESLIHATDCKLIVEGDFQKDYNGDTKYHWFSTYFLAEKIIVNIKPCKFCNP